MTSHSHLSDVWFSVTDLEVASGSGCVVTTTGGERVPRLLQRHRRHQHRPLPSAGGRGHRRAGRPVHPRPGQRLQARPAEPLADRLAEITPDPIDTFFFANSGAEATEGGVKLARQATGRPNVIVFEGSFHGRTMLTMAMTTSKTGYRAGYQPLPAGVFVAPFPTPCASAVTSRRPPTTAWPALRHLLVSPDGAGRDGGDRHRAGARRGRLLRGARPRSCRGIEEICREHGILFVADEIQTGFARTGRMFAVEHAGVRPDILLMAKGIGSGFPISAIGASAEVMGRWPKGSHGGTYGGNPIGCAAALATIDVLTEPGFLENVDARGQQLRAGLEKLAADDDGVAEVRGLGLMVAVEFADPATGGPDGARAGAVLRSA